MGKRHDEFFEFMKIMPIVDTNQVAEMFFLDCNSPTKRASQFLTELREEKHIEGMRREMGKTKIWRLTRSKKKEMGITKRSVPLTIKTIDHILGVGTVYIRLKKEETDLEHFQYELREVFVGSDGRDIKYCPDSFFVFNGVPYFLELQRSPLSALRWSEKWKYGTDFITNKHYENTSFSHLINVPPRILVISKQNDHVIKKGSEKLNLVIHKTIDDFIETNKLNDIDRIFKQFAL